MNSGYLHQIAFSSLSLIAMLVCGCGSDTSASIGFVQYDDGEPVKSGSIEFRSITDKSSYASRIAPNGGFLLADRDGDNHFPPGEYEVVVVQIVLTEDLAAEAHEHGRTVPRRYADYYTSGLRYTNQADRTEPIQIELETEP